jgi:uncharacterized repeat protein (TIGR02543 family)
MNTNIIEGLSASATLWSGCVRRTAMALLVMLLAVTAATVRAEQNDNWEYFINGDQCIINGYVGDTTVGALVIPSIIDGATVVGFGYDLRKLSNLEILVFEAGIAITDMPTVSGCKNLRHINSPGADDCLPASITKVPDYAFTGTNIYKLTMPGVTTVGSHAFEGCNALDTVTFNKPATIGYEAFAKIYDETRKCVITYPGSVSAWEYTRYHHSPNLVINCSDGSLGWCGDEWVESEHTNMIYNDDCLYWVLKDGNLTIDCVPRDNFWDNYKEKQIIKTKNWKSKNVKTLTLDHVYKIQDREFQRYGSLQTVNINSTLTEIGVRAFLTCYNIKDLYFDGTKEQWDALPKGDEWKKGVPANYCEHWRSTSTVSFNANGHGTAPESQTIQWSNGRVAEPDAPTENGFAFKGWYKDAGCTELWDFSTDVVNGDTTLYARWELELYDDAVNSADITACDHSLLDVQLTDRTLYIDDKWNTLCLPFSLTSLSGTPLDGFTVKELDLDTEYNGHKTGVSGSTLYLNFKDATAIEAGKPYIVKKASAGLANIENPVFDRVTIDGTAPTAVTSEDGKVSFVGNYDPVTLAASNRSVLYFGSANKLFWPDEDVQLNAFRAHFTLNGTQVAEDAAGAKGITNMVIGFGDEDEVVTGINEAAADSSLFTPHSSLSGWHTVSGIRLSGKPSQKGMYIHNGKTVVVE